MILTSKLLFCPVGIFILSNNFIKRNEVGFVQKWSHLCLIKSWLRLFLINFESSKLIEPRHFKHWVCILEFFNVLKVTFEEINALSIAIKNIQFFLFLKETLIEVLLQLLRLFLRFDCIYDNNSITLSIENLKDLLLLDDCFSFS